MSSAPKVGKETTHGTVAASLISVPCNFSSKMDKQNRVWEEDRQGQDRHFAMSPGRQYNTFEVSDSAFYHDTSGVWLASAMGEAVSTVTDTVYDNVFKFLDDPRSLSLQWTQRLIATQGYQALYGVVDTLEFKYAADGDLVYSCSGIAMGETEISAPTHSFTTTRPLQAWQGAVNINGSASASLLSGSVKFSRSRTPFFTINNSADPNKMAIGSRMVEFELIVEFAGSGMKAEYDQFKLGNTRSFDVTFADAGVTIGTTTNPTLIIDLGTTAYEAAEIDDSGDIPLLKLTGKGLYNSGDASKAVVTVTSTRDYEIAWT